MLQRRHNTLFTCSSIVFITLYLKKNSTETLTLLKHGIIQSKKTMTKMIKGTN